MGLSSTNISLQVSSFLDYKVIERGISEKTRESYHRTLSDFFSFRGAQTRPTREVEVKRYISSCSRKLSPQTVVHHISVLREFFRFLQLERLIHRNPMERIALPERWKTMPRFMSEIEVYKLIEAPGPGRGNSPLRHALILRDRAICETLYAGGLRVSELISARLCDLNLQAGVLVVLGKGSKERIAPLGRLALDALRAYLDVGRRLLQRKRVSPYLFIGLRQPMLTRQAINYLLRERAKRAGVPHVHPHMLRHSMATHLMNHGANLRVIQEILGHADISTTEIYTHLLREDVKNVLLRCHPRNNPQRTQMALFQRATPVPVSGPAMCTQCRNPVCEQSNCLCAVHLGLARAAVKRHRERASPTKKAPSSTIAHRRGSDIQIAT